MNSEEQFTKNVVIPMLHHVGYRRIRYVHGQDEHGRDLVFFDIDRLGQETLHAAQVKYGDIRGSEKQKIQAQIIPQLLEGFRQPYRDPETGKTHCVSRMFLIISGELLGTSRNQIHAALEREPNIIALDRQTIDLLVSRDGVDTVFGFTRIDGSSISTGTRGRLPRLPILAKGMFLEIPVFLENTDFHADAFEIDHVSYDPVHQCQTVHLLVGDVSEEVVSRLLKEIYASLRESIAYLWEYWEMHDQDDERG